MYFAGYSADVGPASPTLNDNAWHMLSVTYDGTTVKLYVDGSFQTSGTPTLNTFDGLLTVGQRWDNTNGVTCNIDEIGICTRALSASEITQLYNGGQGMSYAALTPVTLTAATGSYVMTGNNINLYWSIGTLTATTGSFSLTGYDVNLKTGGYTHQTVHSSSYSDQTKNVSSFSNQSKDTSIWVNENISV